MEDWETLCRYVNEETFEKMGWDVETFKSLNKEDAIEELREYMYQYGITNRYSVCMFLATLGKECGDGKYLMEDRGEEGEGEEIKKRNEEEFRNLTYEYETRGAGLIQLTGVDQKEFLEFLKNKIETDPNMEKNKLEGINRMLDGYPDVFPIKIINGESETCCVNSENVTQFVATDYPIESAVWYWASYNKCIYYTDYDNGNSSTMPLNEYVTIIGEEQKGDSFINLFLATQYYVNGSPWKLKRLQKIAECTDETYKFGEELTFTEDKPYHEPLPKGWNDRKKDWDALLPELFG